jgi:hypothetical protein
MMAKKTIYVIGGTEEVATLKEVAAVLGVSRVTAKDIEAGKYPEVEVRVVDEEPSLFEDVAEEVPMEEPTADAVDTAEDTDDDQVLTDTHEDDTQASTDTHEDTQEDNVDDAIEYPERGEFKDVKAMKRYIKKLTDEQLKEWCELEGVIWKPCEHPAINRMRMAMAIKALHFPETAPKKSSKKKSKYADYTTEQLVQMALENDIVVRDAKGDPRIERMYVIMALREAGLLA